MPSEGERFELDPRLRDYFEGEVGLTEDQIELVQGLSRRILHSLRKSNRERGSQRITREDYARAEVDLRKAVVEGKISGDDARARLEGMRKAMSEHRDRGNERPDWGAIKRRIEGAVDRGDLTREEADAKYREIKKRMSREDSSSSLRP